MATVPSRQLPHVQQVRLSRDQYDWLVDAAERQGLRPGTLLRTIVHRAMVAERADELQREQDVPSDVAWDHAAKELQGVDVAPPNG